MSVGGIDVVLLAPANECLVDIILRVCRRHWSGAKCYFQDAHDAIRVHSLDDPWVWKVGTACKEFFVYQNEAAVQAWAEGPTRDNVNTMLYFLIGEATPSDPDVIEVGLVCDRLTPWMKRLIADLSTTFQTSLPSWRPREAA